MYLLIYFLTLVSVSGLKCHRKVVDFFKTVIGEEAPTPADCKENSVIDCSSKKSVCIDAKIELRETKTNIEFKDCSDNTGCEAIKMAISVSIKGKAKVTECIKCQEDGCNSPLSFRKSSSSPPSFRKSSSSPPSFRKSSSLPITPSRVIITTLIFSVYSANTLKTYTG